MRSQVFSDLSAGKSMTKEKHKKWSARIITVAGFYTKIKGKWIELLVKKRRWSDV
jgi:hypothetical protein